MTLDTDFLIDRRRLKRRLTAWRMLAIAAVVGAIAIAASRSDETALSLGLGGDYVARVTVGGIIGDSRERHELLVKLRDDAHVKAVIVAVDSPGGTTTGGEALYLDLRAIAEKKPVAAVFGTVAASAAYLGGIATDYIVARGNTITGSVGVIFQWAEVSDLLSKLGIKVEEIRSGPLKAIPSLFTPADENARRVSEELVKESQTWFTDLVVERRKDAVRSLDEIKTGRIYTGRQALTIGLIDAIGDEKTAVTWIESKNAGKGLKVIDRKPESAGASSFFRSAIGSFAVKLGLSSPLENALASEFDALKNERLAGLFSIWRP